VIYIIKYSSGFRYFISHNIKIGLKTRQHYYNLTIRAKPPQTLSDTTLYTQPQNSATQLGKTPKELTEINECLCEQAAWLAIEDKEYRTAQELKKEQEQGSRREPEEVNKQPETEEVQEARTTREWDERRDPIPHSGRPTTIHTNWA
jgi:hypothetical protein